MFGNAEVAIRQTPGEVTLIYKDKGAEWFLNALGKCRYGAGSPYDHELMAYPDNRSLTTCRREACLLGAPLSIPFDQCEPPNEVLVIPGTVMGVVHPAVARRTQGDHVGWVVGPAVCYPRGVMGL